ncbi:MAG: precorrin-8X methylmutase [Methanospirillum sp.]
MASSPRGDITENTYTDLGATTPEALAISTRSREFARQEIGNATLEDRVRQRCAIAVGDIAMANLLRFRLDPVEAGLAALEGCAPIVTDIRMVEVGLQKRGHASPVLCMLDFGEDLATASGITRTSAGLLALGDRLDDAIIVIGNAPSALLALCSQIETGLRPALVIGTPVGFVNAAESKALLRTLQVPSISNEGTRGGTPVAVAAMNEIITIFAERRV